MSRLPNILVIGSSKRLEGTALQRAVAAGRFVASSGANLITGGRGGAMAAASEAYRKSPLRCGQVIGILPGRTLGLDGWDGEAPLEYSGSDLNPWVDIAIRTHLPGDDPLGPMSRNPINVLSADLVVALDGGAGTEAELRLAVALGKPVISVVGASSTIGNITLDALNLLTTPAASAEELAELAGPILSAFLITRPRFDALRGNYSTQPSSIHNCSMSFPNTCAIRMSEALVAQDTAFLDRFDASGLTLCPHRYMRGAQDLAAVLRRGDVFGNFNQGFSRPGTAPASMNGRKGIICYMNIPQYPDAQGHIDLWDGSGPVGDEYWNADPIWFWHLP